ncbi:MAG TPA: molybdopterin biosynthesis protein MoeY [Chromatiaceae bacterium]|nr:molybdopterin biosynthesis protein MoeY [Chromatiaceae bacterium]
MPATPIERILDLARWAPSGDNTQPWRFELRDERHFVVHARDTRDWCIYDLDGRASQIAVGALLETIAIAATGEAMRAHYRLRADAPETSPVIEVELDDSTQVAKSPLLPFIKVRTTQRRPLATTPLSLEQKRALEESVGQAFRIHWIEGGAARWRMAKLLFRSARIRLTIPEAYKVHRRIIEWDARFSRDRIPDQAIGLDAGTLKLMKWVMGSWQRVQFMNRWLSGTLVPRIQLDLLPGYRCAAHFLILAEKPLETIEDWLEGGRALQRFWLTATRLGLQLQPEMTPLIFSRYVATSRNFTVDSAARQAAARLAAHFQEMIGREVRDKVVFMGRLGIGRMPEARSVRRSSGELRQ